jgi:MFS family permease
MWPVARGWRDLWRRLANKRNARDHERRSVWSWHDPEEDWRFAPNERPSIPGSPANPVHPRARRIAYALVAILVGVTGGLGNAFVAVNLPQLEGSLGLYAYEIAWLPTVYVMTNVPANLILVKIRQEFGLRLFTILFLTLYAVVTFTHILVHSFASALAVRAASGIAAAPLTTLGLYYTTQALPMKWRLQAFMIGIVIPQLATPLARLFSTELLGFKEWQSLYTFELGISLVALAAVLLVRLPPSDRSKAFAPMDLVSFALFTSGGALLCAVLGEGRYLWWTDTPWLGWALCGSIPLIFGALYIEHHRRNPLIATHWHGSGDMLRFIVVAIFVRIAFSEQAYAAVGLLTALGFENDQFHMLFTIITVAIALGMFASATLVNPRKSAPPVIFAVALIAAGAIMDSDATNLTRPQQFYASQALIAFSTAFFMGPALVFGMTRAMRQSPTHLVNAFVLFSMIQNVGGLIGSAFLGTFQVIREKVHSNALVERITLTDPSSAGRLQENTAIFGQVTLDPLLRGAEGATLLSQQVTREANILAYDDVFQLVALLAALLMMYLGVVAFLRTRHERRAAGLPVGVSIFRIRS